LLSPVLSGSGIYRVRPMFNLMLEGEGGTIRENTFALSPGTRSGWNFGDHQLILGAAVPVTWVAGSVETGGFVYLSYELPFKK
jgi:hypothetical protein